MMWFVAQLTGVLAAIEQTDIIASISRISFLHVVLVGLKFKLIIKALWYRNFEPSLSSSFVRVGNLAMFFTHIEF